MTEQVNMWISRTNLMEILTRWSQDGMLIAPKRAGGEVFFAPIDNVEEICWDYVNSLISPKQFLLPEGETLLSYERTDEGEWVINTPNLDVPEKIVFGIRSCDVAGIAYLDQFLLGRMFDRKIPPDPLYKRRRERLTLISVVCQKPGSTCMCVCCDGGPALKAGYDWQLTELSEGWLVEVGTEKGWALMETVKALVEPAETEAVTEKEERLAKVIENFQHYSPHHRVPTMAASRGVSRSLVKEPFWDLIGARCVECGGCSYLCPTCFCFNCVDLLTDPDGSTGQEEPFCPLAPGQGAGTCYKRVRFRDNCILEGFVRQAGGIYPRRNTGERCRNRFFHKLSWQFFQRMHRLGCTGCGRCVKTCLGEIGMSQVATEITDALTSGRKVALTGQRVGKGEAHV